MKNRNSKNQLHINVQKADLSDNSSLIKVDTSDLEHTRDSYLRFLTRDQSRTTIPLGLPDIKASDPSHSGGILGLKAVYIGPKTQTKFSITRTEMFLGAESSGLVENIHSTLENNLGLTFSTSREIKEGVHNFATYIKNRISQEVQNSNFFEDASNSIFEMPITAYEAVCFLPRLVILGSPGSGKTTFMNYLVFSIASLQLEQSNIDEIGSLHFGQEYLTPIPISLKEYVKDIDNKETDSDLIKFAARQYEKILDPNDLEVFFRHEINTCSAIILFDGLDEVPPKYRVKVKNDIEAINLCSDSRIIVTCRNLSYQDDRWKIDKNNFGVVTLAPFNDEQINDFLSAFYTEVASSGYSTVRPIPELINDIKKLVARPDIHRLATNPLLLTIIALIHITRGELANSRALLYEEAVDWLLTRWAAKNRRNDRSIRQILEDSEIGSSINELEEILRKIAFEIHDSTDDMNGTAMITDTLLISYLRQLHPARNLSASKIWAMELVEAIKEQAGVLVATDVKDNSDIYTFPHRTFQEYLAARHIASQEFFSDFINLYGRKNNLWHEVVLFAVGYKGLKDGVDAPISAASKLSAIGDSPTDDDWKAAILAGEVILEIGLNRAKKSGRLDEIERIIRHLSLLIEKNRLSALERNIAGNILSSLGDSRPGVICSDNNLPNILWVELPKGTILITEAERPLIHQITTDEFKISKYPITNDQYHSAVKAGILSPPAHWKGDTPPKNTLNHPVVFVSWMDAIRYCDWLSEITGSKIRLPTSSEWTKASRGIIDARPWPWGNLPEYHKANIGLTGIGGTCAVGLFPLGDADPWIGLPGGGPQDMSGNVNEWCLDIFSSEDQNYDDTETPRKVRGGSYRGGMDVARCLPTNAWRVPKNTHPDVGFRILSSI